MRKVGFRHSEETKTKMSLASKGKPKSPEHKEALRLAAIKKYQNGFVCYVKKKWKENPNFLRGENNGNWKGNISEQAVKHRMRGGLLWKKWRESIFERDNYRCLDCGKGGYLEPHHIIPLRVNMKKSFDINNGITLCRPCHKKTVGKELELARTYFSLIQVQA